jgi:DNA-binding NtrC family response regulator
MQNTGQMQSPTHAQRGPQVPAQSRATPVNPIPREPSFLASAGGLRAAGVSAAWRKLLLQAEMAGPHVQIAAIEGESGVGKQTLARYLLSRSPLAGSPFHRWDAREWLLSESDLAAIAGFTYLDRVDLLAVPGQGRLLGALKNLQDRTAGRVMLVVSSQSPLRQMASQGQLLPDLAFRLAAVRFSIPPLRARREDIAPIAQALLERVCARYPHRPVTLSPGALARLLQHQWPGNVRELGSVLEAALLEADRDVIRPEDLALDASPDPATACDSFDSGHGNDLSLDSVIFRHVHTVLALHHGNKLRAARQLRISRSTLYRILGNQNLLSH